MKIVNAIVAMLFLASCAAEQTVDETQPVLGQFRLGHNIAIADNVQLGPFSREMTEVQIEAAVQDAVADRLRRYDGDGLYHLGIVVGGLVLAQPGIPVIYAPKSVMILDVTVFDNRTQKKLNAEPKRIFAGEGFQNIVPVLGSGYVRSSEQQLSNLSNDAARQIENWLRDQPEWFSVRPDQVRVPYNLRTAAPQIDTTSVGDVQTNN